MFFGMLEQAYSPRRKDGSALGPMPLIAAPGGWAAGVRVVWTLAVLTLREALRQRFAAGLAGVALLVAVSGWFLQGLDLGGAQGRFLVDVGWGALVFFGSGLAVIAPSNSFFADLDQRTVLSVLAKPVQRWQYLLGKWLGAWVLLGMLVVVLAVTVALLLWAHQLRHPGAGDFSAWGLAVTAGLTWLRLGVVAAMVLAIASYARSNLFTLLAGGAALVIGQLQYLARDHWQALEHPLGRSAAWLVAHLFPNLQAFEVAEVLVLPGMAGLAPVAAWGLAGYAALYILGYLAIARWLFQHREL